MSKEAIKLALEAYCKTLHPLWNTGISRTEAEGFFNAGFKAAEALAKQELLFEVDGEMLTANQVAGVALFDFQEATGCNTAEEFKAKQEQGEPVTADEKLARMKSKLAYMRGQQEQGEPVFIVVCKYRSKQPNGKKARTPHSDGVSWLHSIVGVSRTKEDAERMAKASEESYLDMFPGHRNSWFPPMYVWEVEERAIESAHGIKE